MNKQIDQQPPNIDVAAVTQRLVAEVGSKPPIDHKRAILAIDATYMKYADTILDTAKHGKARILSENDAAIKAAVERGGPLPNLSTPDMVTSIIQEQMEVLKKHRDEVPPQAVAAAKAIINSFLAPAEKYVGALERAAEELDSRFGMPHVPSATVRALRFIVDTWRQRMEGLSENTRQRPLDMVAGLLAL
jgi:hypothetical protein